MGNHDGIHNGVRGSSSGKTERKREGGGRSSVSRGRGLLIEDPRTPRGPRSPDSARISSEKETPIGSLLPDFEFPCFVFLFFFSLWALIYWAETGFGYNILHP